MDQRRLIGRSESRVPKTYEGWRVRTCYVGKDDLGYLTVHSTAGGWWWATVSWWTGDVEMIGPLRSSYVRSQVESHHAGCIMSFLLKRSGTHAGQAKPGSVVRGSLSELPGVFEYLSADHYPDGEARDKSALIVLIQEGLVKVCLSDKDQGQSIWRSGESLEDALLALELEVTKPNPDWRAMNSGPQKGQKKKK